MFNFKPDLNEKDLKPDVKVNISDEKKKISEDKIKINNILKCQRFIMNPNEK